MKERTIIIKMVADPCRILIRPWRAFLLSFIALTFANLLKASISMIADNFIDGGEFLSTLAVESGASNNPEVEPLCSDSGSVFDIFIDFSDITKTQS